MPLKLCNECGKEFVSTGKRRKYCSELCYAAGRKKNVLKGIKKYLQTEKGKAARARVVKKQQTEEGKKKFYAAIYKYQRSEKGKKTRAKNNAKYTKKFWERLKNDPEKMRIRQDKINAYIQRRRKQDIDFAVISNLRSRFKIWFKRKGEKRSTSIKYLIGCSKKELIQHLEKQFQPGMTWENYGKWHIDHIKPLSKFNIKNKKEVAMAMHYTNLQPLWATENQKKFNKILPTDL